ncbi:MAG TPA: response regulator [Rubrobacteraceae bacterium]|nr:response regulator [Rubrobacteraceae bacterium]
MSKIPNAQPIEILLVEDNPGDARLAVEAFKDGAVRFATNLHHVKDGSEALDFLYRRGGHSSAVRPDLVLLDLNLPRKDGREVLAEVKGDDDLKLIPILILTTSQAERDILDTYGLHANGYITKPIDLDEFASVVESIKDFWFTTAKLPQEER